MIEIESFFPFLLVAIFWGATNPLIENSVNETENFEADDFSVKGFWNVIKRKKFVVAFGINQIGSVLYGILLGMHEEHYSSLLANSLTTVVTFIAESYFKKKKFNWKNVMGMGLIVGGIYLIV